jgi:mannitol/fructose-specific phosphotransferase system IIA component (Ntr-type)
VPWPSPFGGGGVETVKFVFLLITPTDYYGDLLAILARTARLMVLPHLREELLACATPAQVLEILDPLAS